MTQKNEISSARSGVLTWAGFGIALLLLILVAWLTRGTTALFVATAERVDRTERVLAAFTNLRAGLYQAESARRAHALTGREEHLADYRDAMQQLTSAVAQAKHLTRGEADQGARMQELVPIIDRRITLFAAGLRDTSAASNPKPAPTRSLGRTVL